LVKRCRQHEVVAGMKAGRHHVVVVAGEHLQQRASRRMIKLK
jgi:hypothetical protein